MEQTVGNGNKKRWCNTIDGYARFVFVYTGGGSPPVM
jgi:hypothetical protein